MFEKCSKVDKACGFCGISTYNPTTFSYDDVEKEIETLRGELRKEIQTEDVVSENVRLVQGEQLKALLDERDELLIQVRQATEPAENWDFGFVFDIKTRFI